MSKKLIIFGTGELAELANFYFTNDSDYEVVGFVLDEEYVDSKTYLGLPLVTFQEVQNIFPPSDFHMFVAIGYSSLNQNRKSKYLEAKNKGYTLASYISSKSEYWSNSLEIGENTFIMEGNIYMPFAKIGNNVLIWINNIIAHHMVIEDHVTITSHCAIGGNVTIKEQSFLGLNCTIRNNITVGKCSIIGAGANVVKEVKDFEVIMGNPGKPLEKDSRKLKI